MSRHVATAAHLPVICLLVQRGQSGDASSRANLSVFAPVLAACRDLAVLCTNSNIEWLSYVVCHSQGQFATEEREVTLPNILKVACEVKTQRLDQTQTVAIKCTDGTELTLQVDKILQASRLSQVRRR